MIDVGLALLGAIVGFLVGLTSAGTGSLGTTLLLVFYGDPASPPYIPGPVLVGSSTLQGTVMKGVGTLRNWLDETLESRYALWIVAGALPFTAVGAFTTGALFRLGLFEVVLAVVLLVAAFFIVFEAAVLERGRAAEMPALTARLKTGSALLGAAVGFLAGLTSVGTGTIVISTLILLLRVPPRQATSIAILVGALVLSASGVSHFAQGNIDFEVVGLLIAGSIPGILVGTRLRGRLDPEPLRVAIAVVIALASARLLIKAITGSNFFGL